MMPLRIALPALCLCGLLGACAADPAATKAAFDRGLVAYDSGDFANAYQTWDVIKDDDLAALRNVATMLRTGKGVGKDPGKAEDLLEQAAEDGLASAAYDLGDMLLNGEAGPPDIPAALDWLDRAAEARHPLAALKLARLYTDGPLPHDPTLARKYYRIAAQAGVAEAVEKLADSPAPPAP
jgi:uncharacterized protein